MEDHISRAMWRLYEPIHSVVYFHPNATNSYKAVGLKGGWMSYFASRSAALGTPSKEVVEALFYHFAPAMVARAIPDAWTLSSPDLILNVRNEIAIDTISGGIRGTSFETDLHNLSAQLLEIASSLPKSGRALYAAHLNIDWEQTSELMLFGAATLLREHRGDTHNAALAAHGIDGVQSHLLQIATGSVTHDVIFPTRGWSEDAWKDGLERLISNGLLSQHSTPENPILTDLGRQTKNQVEFQTDDHSNPWDSIKSTKLANLRSRLTDISALVKRYVGFPANNPIGV